MKKIIRGMCIVCALGTVAVVAKVEMQAASTAKIPKEEWECSDCGTENLFWYTFCIGCGKCYW